MPALEEQSGLMGEWLSSKFIVIWLGELSNPVGSVAVGASIGKRGQEVVCVWANVQGPFVSFGWRGGGKGWGISLLVCCRIPGISKYSGLGNDPSPWRRLAVEVVEARPLGSVFVIYECPENRQVVPIGVWMDCKIETWRSALGEVSGRAIQGLWRASRKVT